jgi:aminopeptidase N
MRSSRVRNVEYQIDLRLSRELPEYAGEVEILFELSDPSGDLTLDFTGGTVYSMTANGTEVDVDYNGFYIVLPEATLRRGGNIVRASYSRPYSDDGSGLYRFIDPEDDRAYLYSDFEPYDQNRLFPSFDQPDLKARYTTEVTAPASWTVIANVRETSIQNSGDERIWRFPQTLPISTYIYALHAGDYRVW